MTIDNIMELLLFIVLVVLPLLGITMRLTLKPIVNAVIQLSEGLSRSRESRIGQEDAAALQRMQEDLSELRQKVAEMESAHSFYRGLIAPQHSSDPNAPSP